ncbi:hypothetical protein SAMD00023353_4000470 [Rosellinia necatrix]|uniref:Uncharacterized protein n=1 Tax=Rosellinia necatrix TaxID=77044 RepID=A0A1S8A9B5_ROSNE|nr:hypothetical protein SAMD00023353_4000470 [Rosellinia necatrix]
MLRDTRGGREAECDRTGDARDRTTYNGGGRGGVLVSTGCGHRRAERELLLGGKGEGLDTTPRALVNSGGNRQHCPPGLVRCSST